MMQIILLIKIYFTKNNNSNNLEIFHHLNKIEETNFKIIIME